MIKPELNIGNIIYTILCYEILKPRELKEGNVLFTTEVYIKIRPQIK